MTISAAPARIAPPDRAFRLYVVAWALLAGLALGYLALIAVRPDLAAQFQWSTGGSSPEDNRGQRALAQATAAIKELTQTVTALKTELGATRTQLAVQETQFLAIQARVTALEATRQTASQNIAAKPDSSASPANALASATVQGVIEDRAGKPAREPRKPDTIAAAAADGLPAALTAQPVASGPPRAVHLTAGPSLDALRLSWQLLLERHKPVLKSLEPRYIENKDDPSVVQLIAGPIATELDARRVCDRLKAKRVACEVVIHAGQPL